MSDYNLGTASGQVVIEYDDRPAKDAAEDMGMVGKAAESMAEMFNTTWIGLRRFFGNWSEETTRFSRNMGVFSGGIAVLAGLSSMTGRVSGSLLGLRGGIGIVGALGLAMGGLPRSAQGFPRIVRNVIQLSAAIKVFSGSSDLIARVMDTIPGLRRFSSVVRKVGDETDRLAGPIHNFARLALIIGSLRSGIRIATSLAKAISMITLAGGGIGAVIITIAGLVNAVKQLSGVMGVLPGLGIIFAGTAGAVAAGMQGIKESLDAMDKPFEEWVKTLDGLAPSAAKAMTQIRGLRNEIQQHRKVIQESLFAGVSEMLRDLYTNYALVLEVGLSRVAASVNNIVRQFAGFANSKATVDDVKVALNQIRAVLDNVSSGIQPLLNGLRDLGLASLEVVDRLTLGFDGAARGFEEWAARVRADGSLYDWTMDGFRGVQQLMEIFSNLGGTFDAILSAFGIEGDGFLGKMVLMTQQMENFFRSAGTQEGLGLLADTIRRLADMSSKVLGAAFEQLGPILANLQPFIVSLSQSFGTTLVAAINVLGPILAKIAGWLSALSPVIGPILGVLLGLGIAFKAVMVAGKALAAVGGTLAAGFRIVTAAWKVLRFVFISNPWIGIIIAVIALVVIIVKNWDKIKEYLLKAWEFIKAWAIRIWQAIVQWFVGVWDGVKSTTVSVWEFIKTWLERIWNGIKTAIMTVFNGILAYYKFVFNVYKTIAMTVWNAIVSFIEFYINIIKTVITTVLGFLRGIWEKFWSVFGELVKASWELIKAVINLGIAVIQLVIRTFVFVVTALWNKFWAEFIAPVINAWNLVRTWVAAAADWVWGKIVAVWNAIVATTQSVWDSVWGAIVIKWNAIKDTVSAAASFVWEKIEAAWNAVKNATIAVWDSVVTAIQIKWNAIKTVVQTAIRIVTDAISSAWNTAKSLTSQAWQAIVDAISAKVGAVRDKIQDIINTVRNAFGNAASILYNAGRDIIQGLINGITSMIKNVTAKLNELTSKIKAAKGPPERDKVLLTDNAHLIMDSLIRGFVDRFPAVLKTVKGLTEDLALRTSIDYATGRRISSSAGSNTYDNRASSVTNNIYNPAPEPASESTASAMRRLSSEGAFA